MLLHTVFFLCVLLVFVEQANTTAKGGSCTTTSNCDSGLVCGTSNLCCAPRYLYCAKDHASPRLLAGGATFTSSSLTAQMCFEACFAGGSPLSGTKYKYAALEYGNECWCGNALSTAETVPSGCTMECAGNAGQTCGSSYAAQLYECEVNGYIWDNLYCSEDTESRVLTGSGTTGITDLIPQSCQAYCYSHGFNYAATEYGNECYCGSSPNFWHERIGACTTSCEGDSSQKCGGEWAASLYWRTTNAHSDWANGPDGDGCYHITGSATLEYVDDSNLTPAICKAKCYMNSSKYAVTGGLCNCYTSVTSPYWCDSCTCELPCPGDDSQACGGHLDCDCVVNEVHDDVQARNYYVNNNQA